MNGIVAGKDSGDGWTASHIPDLDGMTALVTGAAGGLGLATAKALAAHRARVILADLNRAGGEAAAESIRYSQPNARVEYQPLDLADLAGIRRFADTLAEAGQPLDLLINIAGILPPLQRASTRDGFELKFGINYLGHFALTGWLLESLLRSPRPRVVSISSIVQARARIDFDDLQAERRYAPQRVYGQAKLACLMFGLELHDRARAAGSPLTSTIAHPGIARTGIGSDRKTQRHRRLRDWMEDAALAAAMRWFGQSPAEGALPILYAATAPEAASGRFYGPGGFGQFAGHPEAVRPSKTAQDKALRQRLWRLSEELTGVRY